MVRGRGARASRALIAALTGAAILGLGHLAPVHAQQQSQAAFGAKRCLNMGNSLEAFPAEGAWGRAIEAADFRAIAGVGYDTVRIPVRWNNKAEDTAPYTIDPDFMTRVEEVVGQAVDAGLIVVLNIHHYDELHDDPAGERDKFIGLWTQIAERFKDAPSSVVFELINEPHNNLTNDLLPALYEDALAVIRPTNPTRPVMIGGDGYNGIRGLPGLTFPDDEHLIITFHNYDPFFFTHQGASFIDPPPPTGVTWGDSQSDADLLEDFRTRITALQARFDGPIFVGEMGVYQDVPLDQRTKWTRDFTNLFEEMGLSWCMWAYTNTFHTRFDRDWVTPLLEVEGFGGPN